MSWRWAFFINVVVAVAVIVIAPFVLREPARGARPKLDVPGAVTITLALVALVFGIDTAGHNGWTHPGTWGPILGALILFAVFLKIEARVTEPLVAPGLLKRSNIGWGNTAGLLAFGTFTSLVFLLTLYLQQILGYSAITAGLILGVLGIGTVIGGLVAPKIIGRTSAKTAIVAGLVVQAAATAPLAFAGDTRAWLVPVLILTFVGGIANLVAIVGYVVASTSGVPANQQGLATGLVTMSQQVGIALGTPVMSAIATGMVAATLAARAAARDRCQRRDRDRCGDPHRGRSCVYPRQSHRSTTPEPADIDRLTHFPHHERPASSYPHWKLAGRPLVCRTDRGVRVRSCANQHDPSPCWSGRL